MRRRTTVGRYKAPKKRAYPARVDWIFLSLILGLLAFGLLMVFDASVVEAYAQFGDKFHFARRHALWVLLSLAVMLTTWLTPLALVKKSAKPLFITALVLLVAVLIPGIGTKVQGARRWISLGFFNLQPSEITKLAVAVYFSSWLTKHQRFEPFLGLVGLMMGLLILEPDMGTSIVLAVFALTMYFMSGAKMKHLVIILLLGLSIGSILILGSPYRRARLTTFLSPSVDPQGKSYHINQVVIGLGSGGWYGTGIGRSRQKYQYLPEATTDSIFAVVAEELGFLGSSVVIGVFGILITRGFSVANRIQDHFARLLALSVVTWITIQTLLNLSAMVVLVPLTGVPLPFISYGGSALLTLMAGVGLYLNASRYRNPGWFARVTKR